MVGDEVFVLLSALAPGPLSWARLNPLTGVIFPLLTFLLALNVLLLLVGMTMDIFSAIVVVAPLIVPLARQFDMNPYHLGAIFLLNLEVGYLTPPLGLNLYIASLRFNHSIGSVCRAVLPFALLLLGVLGVVTYVPELSTWSARTRQPSLLGAGLDPVSGPAARQEEAK